MNLFNLYKTFFKKEKPSHLYVPTDVTLGAIGYYAVDGEKDDESLGLYVNIFDAPVFIDIKEDNLLEKRKKIAMSIFENSTLIEKNLKIFIACNEDYDGSTVESIGIHSLNLDRAEVFWKPDGYTSLMIDGFEFVNEE